MRRIVDMMGVATVRGKEVRSVYDVEAVKDNAEGDNAWWKVGGVRAWVDPVMVTRAWISRRGFRPGRRDGNLGRLGEH